MISKSGGTIETTSVTKYILHRYGLEFGGEQDQKDHFLTITDPDSPWISSPAQGVTAFHLPKNVGGRFSVLTAVGLVPLAIVGYDIRKLLAGAKTMGDKYFAKDCDTLMKKAYHYAQHAATRGSTSSSPTPRCSTISTPGTSSSGARAWASSTAARTVWASPGRPRRFRRSAQLPAADRPGTEG